tara:strand:- start:424 stop:612 length:189 start_codon:yes stop_codon:yes gene_type:complete
MATETDFQLFSTKNQLIAAALVILAAVITWTLATLDNVYATVAMIMAGFGVVTAIRTWPSVQ